MKWKTDDKLDVAQNRYKNNRDHLARAINSLALGLWAYNGNQRSAVTTVIKWRLYCIQNCYPGSWFYTASSDLRQKLRQLMEKRYLHDIVWSCHSWTPIRERRVCGMRKSFTLIWIPRWSTWRMIHNWLATDTNGTLRQTTLRIKRTTNNVEHDVFSDHVKCVEKWMVDKWMTKWSTLWTMLQIRNKLLAVMGQQEPETPSNQAPSYCCLPLRRCDGNRANKTREVTAMILVSTR